MSTETKSVKTEPARSSVNWDPMAAVAVSITIYFIAQGLGIVLVSLYPSLRNWSKDAAQEWLQNSIAAQFVFVFLIESITILLLYKYLRVRKAKLKDLGFHRRPKWLDLAYALVGLGLYFITVVISISVVKKLIPSLDVEQSQDIGFENARTTIELLLTFGSLVFLPPIAEEILARGFLYAGLKRRFKGWVPILFTSFLFGLAHLQFGSGKALLWVAGIDTFILSLFLCKIKDYTGNLWASIMLHMLKNSVAFLVLFKPFIR